jgi:hypothetical protein
MKILTLISDSPRKIKLKRQKKLGLPELMVSGHFKKNQKGCCSFYIISGKR